MNSPFSNYQNVPYSVSGNSSQNNGILVVPIQSNDSVATYPVAAGTTVMLMNYPAKKFWMKSTGQDGLTQTITEHNFEVVADEKNGDFVSKKEFEEVKKQLNIILEKLGDLLDG